MFGAACAACARVGPKAQVRTVPPSMAQICSEHRAVLVGKYRRPTIAELGLQRHKLFARSHLPPQAHWLCQPRSGVARGKRALWAHPQRTNRSLERSADPISSE